jgi:hypothetical protein
MRNSSPDSLLGMSYKLRILSESVINIVVVLLSIRNIYSVRIIGIIKKNNYRNSLVMLSGRCCNIEMAPSGPKVRKNKKLSIHDAADDHASHSDLWK